jgi:hypothetical protein
MKLSKLTKEAIVRAIWNEVPEIDHKARKVAIQAALVETVCTPEVKALYKTQPGALKVEYCGHLGYSGSYENRLVIVADLTAEQINVALEPYANEDDARIEARNKLTTLVMGCSTRNQLVKLLPECEKYLPAEASTDRSLPVVANVIADMTKLGWPKK